MLDVSCRPLGPVTGRWPPWSGQPPAGHRPPGLAGWPGAPPVAVAWLPRDRGGRSRV